MNITINGKTYEHVKTREHTPVSIYKDKDSFLRIGDSELIKKELVLHKQLISYRFPVAELISEGEFEDKYYYIEKSVGKILSGDIFWEDCKTSGTITEQHFSGFLKLTEQFVKAQLTTSKASHNMDEFFSGIHMDYLQEELPHLKDKSLEAFEKIKKSLVIFPNVLTHGDFNPYNLFEHAVIDFGSAFYAPAGYDIVGNIYHTYNFPKEGDFEAMRRYEFTKEQIDHYFSSMDDIYATAGLPKLTEFLDDFIISKMIWAVVRIQRFPKLQQWRYQRIEKMLNSYLNNEPIVEIIQN